MTQKPSRPFRESPEVITPRGVITIFDQNGWVMPSPKKFQTLEQDVIELVSLAQIVEPPDELDKDSVELKSLDLYMETAGKISRQSCPTPSKRLNLDLISALSTQQTLMAFPEVHAQDPDCHRINDGIKLARKNIYDVARVEDILALAMMGLVNTAYIETLRPKM